MLFIQSNFIKLQGNWQWDLQADSVFCSDVILSYSPAFNGTKAIIHPDDLQQLKTDLTFLQEQKTIDSKFRIITTYGEIKTLTGANVFFANDEDHFSQDITHPETAILEEEKTRNQLNKELGHWHLKAGSFQHAERLAETGAWYINSTTGETVYSDQVFRIFGLQPQSLNMHPYTFSGFIHPEEKNIVVNAFEKAYQEKLPLDIEFRIIRADGKERYVQQTLQWSFSMEGTHILHGVTRDVTILKESEFQWNQAQHDLQFLDKISRNLEQNTSTAHWYINLLTRKTVFSDNFYRIFGLKPQSIPAGFTTFLKFVHLDDQPILEEAIHKARLEHTPFDIEYRIFRPDGKIRFIRQTGKLEIYANRELMLIGNIQDISQQKVLEEKINKHAEDQMIQDFKQGHIEEQANMGSLVWDLQSDKVSWSEYLYTILGLKSSTLNPSPKLILKSIHPTYLDLYKGELSQVMQGHEREEFEIKMLVRSETRQVKVKLTLISHEEKNFLVGTFRDVTEAHKQEKEALEHIQLSEQLTENFPDRIMTTDSNYSFVLWNNACADKYKRKKETVKGRNFFEIFPDYKTEEMFNHFNEVLNGKTIHLNLLSTQNRGFDDWHMLPLHNNSNEVIGILHIIQDVTNDHKLKQQLNERLNFIESLVDSTVDRIIALDRNMNYLYWNKKSEEYYGLQKEQVIGKNILEVFPGLLNDPSFNEFRRAMRGETVHLVESNPAENGYYYETYLVPIKNEKQEVTTILWITHDFSKEYKLLAEQKIAHEILDIVDEACFELDFNSKLVYVNKKAEQLWNKDRKELLHQNLWEVFPQAIDSPLHIAIDTVLKDKVVVQQEFFSKVIDHWIFVMAKPSDKGAVVLFLDIHEQKQNQKKVIQVLNALNEGYYELDKDYRVTFMNKKAEQFFDISSETITGKVLWDVFPQMKETSLYNAIMKTVEENVPIRDVFASPLKGTKNLASITPTGDGVAVIFMAVSNS